MLIRWNDLGSLGRSRGRDFDPFDALRREMNSLFFDFERGFPNFTRDTARLWPRVTLEDTGTALLARADLPGVEEKALDVSVADGALTIRGERPESAPEGYSVHRKEREAVRFARSISLPAKVDVESVQAVLKHGVLTVTLPKAKEAQPRQISVKVT